MPDLGQGESIIWGDERQLLPLPELTEGGWRRSHELPDDIWINIMRFLKPLDIVALRQTSRRLRGPTLNRAVWMHALRVVIADNNIHPSTFPIGEMSTAELENAALGPGKLTRILLREGTGIPETVHRRAINIKRKGDVETEVSSMRLLPGGRFLVVERYASVDLGWRVESIISRKPLFVLSNQSFGYTPLRSFRLDQLTWNERNGALRLFFAVGADPALNSAAHVCIYEIDNFPHTPTGHVLARLNISTLFPMGQEFSISATEEDRLAVTAGGTTLLWDFKKNTTASFSGLTAVIALTNDTIIGYSYDTETLNVYNMPILIPPLVAASTPAASVPPAVPSVARLNAVTIPPSFALHCHSNYRDSAICRLDDEICIFDIRTLDGELERYVVEKITPRVSKACAVPCKIAGYDLSLSLLSPHGRLEFSRNLRVCDDSLVTGAMDVGICR